MNDQFAQDDTAHASKRKQETLETCLTRRRTATDDEDAPETVHLLDPRTVGTLFERYLSNSCGKGCD